MPGLCFDENSTLAVYRDSLLSDQSRQLTEAGVQWKAVAGIVLAGISGMGIHAQKPVVTVTPSGSGQFTTVQAAVDSAGEKGVVIKIAPGTYREKLHIDKPGVELRGTGAKPQDVRSKSTR